MPENKLILLISFLADNASFRAHVHLYNVLVQLLLEMKNLRAVAAVKGNNR